MSSINTTTGDVLEEPEWVSIWTFPTGLRLHPDDPSAFDLAKKVQVRMPERAKPLSARVLGGELFIVAVVHSLMTGDEPVMRQFTVRTTAERFPVRSMGMYLSSFEAAGHLLHAYETTQSLLDQRSEEMDATIAMVRAIKEITGGMEGTDGESL